MPRRSWNKNLIGKKTELRYSNKQNFKILFTSSFQIVEESFLSYTSQQTTFRKQWATVWTMVTVHCHCSHFETEHENKNNRAVKLEF